MAVTPPVSDRISIRLEPKTKKIIERAAAARGQSLTDFVLLSSCREAEDVLQTEQMRVLSDRDRDMFLAALDNPPKPNKKALRAAARYKAARAKGVLL